MEKKQYVSSIKIGDRVDAPFVVVEKKMMDFNNQKKAGEQFMLLRLRDNSGTVKAVLWERANQVASSIAEDSVVWVKGKTQDYKGLQIIIENIQVMVNDEIDLTPFLPVSSRGLDNLAIDVRNQIKKIHNKYLQQLLTELFDRREIFDAFIVAPAGKKVHHNYLGGLAEHCLEIIDIISSMYQIHHERMNWDLVVTASLLHDIGKISEYDLTSPSFQMTDRGKLLGHITLGEELIRKTVESMSEFPDELATELRHMILSHHGEKEWGSPEVPKTFNALCLFYGDLISSRLNQVDKLMSETQTDDGESQTWTEYDPLMGRAFYINNRFG